MDLGDWRGEWLSEIRRLIHQVDSDVVEDWKWRGTPVWSHEGMYANAFKDKVKLTFFHGAQTLTPAISSTLASAVAMNIKRSRKDAGPGAHSCGGDPNGSLQGRPLWASFPACVAQGHRNLCLLPPILPTYRLRQRSQQIANIRGQRLPLSLGNFSASTSVLI